MNLRGVSKGKAAAVAKQQAKGMQLQHIGNLGGFGAIEQIGHVAEEVFAGEVSAEHLFLQWPARPVGEGRILGVEDAFIQESDHGVDGHLGRIVAVTHGGGVFDRRGDHPAQGGAKAVGVLNPLNEEAGAQDNGEDLLERQSQIVGLHLLRRRSWRRSHAYVSVMTVSSKVASPRSPGR